MSTDSYQDRIDDLLARMTIEEKTDQLIQIPLGADENPNNVGEGTFRPTVGSILASRRGAAQGPSPAPRESPARSEDASASPRETSAAARESSTTPRIALIGPAADDADALLGSWRCLGRAEDATSIFAGLRHQLGDSVRAVLGCDYDSADREGFAEAVAAAQSSDVAVLCLGEPSDWTGENASRASIELPGVQEELAVTIADAARAKGVPVVLLIVGGRPLGIERVAQHADAILVVWQPGTMGGTAIADLLLGHRNPCGKLAVSIPRTTGHIPTYYCEHSRARPSMGLYRGVDSDALYEFGEGLSYTTFEYGELSLTATEISRRDRPTATVEVRNTGSRSGTETVLWYIRDPEASITQPVRRLIAIERIDLAAGETARVSLEIDPETHLSYPDFDGNRVLEPGSFILEASRLVEREFQLMDKM